MAGHCFLKLPPASPIEDWGTAIPIEDRDRVIPERLRLCGYRYLKLDSWQEALSNLVTVALGKDVRIAWFWTFGPPE
ncbi:hypothetical protein F2Q69_00029051 [Brassica cretica]|uniref:Uncharacterized protein n=1 Tax=Brassica cretica TaxID=69181 RepID=A0A8S9S5T1_BRACR|nr:hypothetical protein F2Q69_00029051 [Brassica cretica]